MGLGECFTPCLRLLRKVTSAQNSHLLSSKQHEKFNESIPLEGFRAENDTDSCKCPELVSVETDQQKYALLESIVDSSPYAISIHDLLSGRRLVCNAASRALPGGCADLQALFAFDPGSLEDALSRVRNGHSWRGLIPISETAIHQNPGFCSPENGAASRPSLSVAIAPNLTPVGHTSAMELRKAIQLAACPSLMRQQATLPVSEASTHTPMERDLAARSVPIYTQHPIPLHRQSSVNDSAAAAAGAARSTPHMQELQWISRGASSAAANNATATAMMAVAKASRAVAAAKAAAKAASSKHSAAEVALTLRGTDKQRTELLAPGQVQLELLTAADTLTISSTTTLAPLPPPLTSQDTPSLPTYFPSAESAPNPDTLPLGHHPLQPLSSVPPGIPSSTTHPPAAKGPRTRRPDLAINTDISDTACTHVIPAASPNTPLTPCPHVLTSSALTSPFQTAEYDKAAFLGTSPRGSYPVEKYGRSPGAAPSLISFGRVSPVYEQQREVPAEVRKSLRRSTTQLPQLPQNALLEALTTSTWSTRMGYRRCKSSKRVMMVQGGGGGTRSSCSGGVPVNRRSTTVGVTSDTHHGNNSNNQHTLDFTGPSLPTVFSPSTCGIIAEATATVKNARAFSGPPVPSSEPSCRDLTLKRNTIGVPEAGDGVMDCVLEDADGHDGDGGNGNCCGRISNGGDGDGVGGGRCDMSGRPTGATGVLPRMLGLVTKVSTRLPPALSADRRLSRVLQSPQHQPSTQHQQQQQQRLFQSDELMTSSAMAVEIGVVIGSGEEERGSDEECEGPGRTSAVKCVQTSNGRASWISANRSTRNGLPTASKAVAVATMVMDVAEPANQQRQGEGSSAEYEAMDGSAAHLGHTSTSRRALLDTSVPARHSTAPSNVTAAGSQFGAGAEAGSGVASLGMSGSLPCRRNVDRGADAKGEIAAQTRACVAAGGAELSSDTRGGISGQDGSYGACEEVVGFGSSTMDEVFLVIPAVGTAAAGAVEDDVGQQPRASAEQHQGAIEMERWHEVVVSGLRHPVSGAQLVMVTQHDVSARVWAEQQLARVMEAEHALLEAIFPAHVLEHITVMAAASAEATKDGTAQEEVPAAPPDAAALCGGIGGGIAGAAPEAEAVGSAALVMRTVSCSHGPMAQRALLESQQQPVPITGDTFLHLATSHTALTVLFCDIQGFTSMCNVVKPATVMAFLNDLYTRLDAMLDAFGVYKVETIGDCYVAAGGLMKVDPDTGAVTVRSDDVDPQHAHRTVQFAKALLNAAAAVRLPTTGESVRLRVGIHSGPAMSGVVGTRMPRFCLFGDTINTASRMESTGVPGAIHVSQATRDLLPHELWEPTGGVEAKGKGLLPTYLLKPTP